MNNAKAYAMVEERFSAHVKSFNYMNVSEADSDTQYWTVKSRLALASAALDRAPELRVTTPARSLGDVYRTVRKHLTPEELEQWDAMGEALESLLDKYQN